MLHAMNRKVKREITNLPRKQLTVQRFVPVKVFFKSPGTLSVLVSSFSCW